jgi:hypothetical protein
MGRRPSPCRYLYSNQITLVPSGAFGSLPALYELYVTDVMAALILQVLVQQPNHSSRVRRLRKSACAEYIVCYGWDGGS